MVPITFTDEPIFNHNFMAYREDDGFYRIGSPLPPGIARWRDFDSNNTQLSYACPCGCGLVNQIPVYTVANGYGWTWNGNREKPTLSPSIQHLSKCKWHGYLRDGVWVNA